MPRVHPNRLPDERYERQSVVPFIFLHLMPLGAIFTGIGWSDWVLLLCTYWGRMFFITGGYHRYFAHRSYRTNRVFQFVLAFGGLTAAQKGPLWWAGHHRQHHRFTDTVQDAHSPIKGIWFSHIGWIVAEHSKPTPTESISDFAKYPELRFLNKQDWIGPWALGVGCFLIGGASGLFVGFFLSTVLLWHATFMVNSVVHMWGTRRFATTDSSRNNAAVAVLTMGEGWHNNHHHIQSSCRQGFKWWEIDMTFYILTVLSWCRVVRDIKPPHPKMLTTALIADGAYDAGMFSYYWDKAVTRVASGVARTDLTELRAELTEQADQTLILARQLGERTRSPELAEHST